MSLLGAGAICTWNDIAPEGRSDFYAWHVREHIPERLSVPGFRRGRRYVASAPGTSPEFFTMYETESLAVLTSPAYLARLNAPTPWTKRAAAAFRGTIRAASSVVATRGAGVGGILATARIAARDRIDVGAFQAELSAAIARALAMPRVVGAHLCRTDAAASGVTTAESRTRVGDRAIPDWTILIEATDETAATAAAAPMIEAATAAAAGATLGLYRLEFAEAAARSS